MEGVGTTSITSVVEREETALTLPFYGEYFLAFNQAYIQVHGYLALFISLFGVVSNTVNIAVLSQAFMARPTDAILIALAFVDASLMMSFLPFAVHQYILPLFMAFAELRSYSWMRFICFHIIFTAVFHTISVWLTITVAVFQYIAVASPWPAKVQKFCSTKRAIFAIVAAFLCTIVLCTPVYLSVQVVRMKPVITEDLHNYTEGDLVEINTTIYDIDESDLSKKYNHIPGLLAFYVFSVLAKLIPCFLLTYFSLQLVRALIQAQQQHVHLKSSRGLPVCGPESTSSISPNGPHVLLPAEITRLLEDPDAKDVPMSPQTTQPARRKHRTTRVLIAILALFLITEFPSGLLGFLSCFSDSFNTYVFGPLGDLMDVLALTNCSMKFVLYCSMSRHFRRTFCRLFLPSAVTERRERIKRWKSQCRLLSLSSNVTAGISTSRRTTYTCNNRTSLSTVGHE